MFGNLGKLMKLASEMKTKMPELQAKLADSQYAAAAGGGAVTATVNGKLAVVAMKISPQALADLAGGRMDGAMLEDLVKAAVGSAQEQAMAAAAAAMRELTGGMQIPGMDALLG